jgi:hypothetical protein
MNITPRLVDAKIENASNVIKWLESLKASVDDLDEQEDITHLLFIAHAYRADLRRVESRTKLDEHRYYSLRNAKIMTASFIEEMLEENADDLADYLPGQPTSACHVVYGLLVDALAQFTESMNVGRQKNFTPLTEREIQVITSLI